MTAWLISICLSIIALLGGAPSTPLSTQTTIETERTVQVVDVIDGDTIDVLQDGHKARIRYIGMDTPEPYRDGKPACYSHEATLANKKMVEGKQIQLIADKEDKDKYGRLLRYIYVGDTFVNAVLVQEGFARTLTIEPNTAHKKEFAQFQVKAKEEEKGMWGACK